MLTDHSRLTRHASPPSRRRMASHRLWREHDVIKSETYRRQVQSQLIRRAARARSATRQKQNRSLASRLPTSRQRAAPRRAPLWSAARLRGGPAAPDSKPHRAGLCRRRRVCQAGPPPAGPHRARPRKWKQNMILAPRRLAARSRAAPSLGAGLRRGRSVPGPAQRARAATALLPTSENRT